ncbi:MAG: hypothetical protein HWE10_00520 [Gammaproteobacteria bacterium]|nr:hypothetical protein [Gammaproteobacteria bacterium]
MKTVILFFLLLTAASNIKAQELDVRLDVGLSYHAVRYYENILESIPPYNTAEVGQYIGIAVNQALSEKHRMGSRIDAQYLDGNLLNSFRALDYYYQAFDEITYNGFIGAARYDFRTPAYGYTAGVGLYYRPRDWQSFGASIEIQYMDKLARDKLHPDDPDYEWDSFIDIRAITFGINYYF